MSEPIFYVTSIERETKGHEWEEKENFTGSTVISFTYACDDGEMLGVLRVKGEIEGFKEARKRIESFINENSFYI